MDWQGHDYFLQGDSHLGMPSLYSHWACFHVPRIVSVLNVLAEWMVSLLDIWLLLVGRNGKSNQTTFFPFSFFNSIVEINIDNGLRSKVQKKAEFPLLLMCLNYF